MDGKKSFCGSSNSLLDNSVKLLNSSRRNEWNRQQKRTFSRVRMGMRRHRGQKCRFLTLTGVDNGVRLPSEAFPLLLSRIRHMRLCRVVRPVSCSKCHRYRLPDSLTWRFCLNCKKCESGYVPLSKLHYYFPGMRLGDVLKIDFYRVRTGEGPVGVLHVVCFGSYLPREFLLDCWFDLCGSYDVDIRMTRRGVYDSKRLSAYMVNQYVSGQSMYGSQSFGWCFRGYIGLYKAMVRAVGFRYAVDLIDRLLLYGFLKSDSDLLFYLCKDGFNIVRHGRQFAFIPDLLVCRSDFGAILREFIDCPGLDMCLDDFGAV